LITLSLTSSLASQLQSEEHNRKLGNNLNENVRRQSEKKVLRSMFYQVQYCCYFFETYYTVCRNTKLLSFGADEETEEEPMFKKKAMFRPDC
jgi:hypothetical protein